MPGEHVFVDETKHGGLVVAAAIIAPERLQPMRGLMRGQLLKGQSHLHFTKEKDDRRGEIVTALCSSGVRQAQVEHILTYAHLPKRSEPLLWIADATAWCWTHRGWKTRIQPLINIVRTLP
jgi:hypothetical protein